MSNPALLSQVVRHTRLMRPVRALSQTAAACAVGLLLAGSATAAVTFSFDEGANGAVGKYNQNAGNMFSATVDGLTMQVFTGLYETEGGFSTDIDCADGSCGADRRILRKADNGLGVQGKADPIGDIDGESGNDLMSFVFDVPVILKSVVFRKVDADDRVDLVVDGVLTQDEVDIHGFTPFTDFGDVLGSIFGFGADDDTDAFRIASLVVEKTGGTTGDDVGLAPAPLPAAGILLLGALGGLGYAARRRKAG